MLWSCWCCCGFGPAVGREAQMCCGVCGAAPHGISPLLHGVLADPGCLQGPDPPLALPVLPGGAGGSVWGDL